MAANKRGPDFSELAPKTDRGVLRTLANRAVATSNPTVSSGNLQNGNIAQVTPTNSFRIGQQVMFWLTIFNPAEAGSGTYLTQLRLKPWWLRPNLEFRAPSPGNLPGSWLAIDEQTFGGGVQNNNRRCWVPSQKIVSVTPFAAGPVPPPSIAGTVDSYYMDDVWVFDLQAPTDPAYAATPIGGQQGPWRATGFLYIAHGYALGFTASATYSNGPPAFNAIPLELTWTNGTLG